MLLLGDLRRLLGKKLALCLKRVGTVGCGGRGKEGLVGRTLLCRSLRWRVGASPRHVFAIGQSDIVGKQ